jgi:hypothetical protein
MWRLRLCFAFALFAAVGWFFGLTFAGLLEGRTARWLSSHRAQQNRQHEAACLAPGAE